MRHALRSTDSAGPLSISVVGATIGARLVPAPGPLDLLPARCVAAVVRAVPVAPIAQAADVKVVVAPAAAPPPKLLHPTPRVEVVSTGDPSPIIISSETKRLHPRGDSAAAGSPVSSTSSEDPRPVPATQPVSGPAQIPCHPALALIDGPRFAVIVSTCVSHDGHRLTVDGPCRPRVYAGPVATAPLAWCGFSRGTWGAPWAAGVGRIASV